LLLVTALVLILPIAFVDSATYQALAAGVQAGGVIVTLGFIGVQISQTQAVARATADAQVREWDIRRKQATIDAVVSTAGYRESLKAFLPENDRDPKAVAAWLRKAKRDPKKMFHAGEYFNHLTDLAVGVTQGVFDLDTVSMLEGGRIIDTVEAFAEYIADVRQRAGRPSIWEDVEDLARQLKEQRAGKL
jgi:hypothetical protein